MTGSVLSVRGLAVTAPRRRGRATAAVLIEHVSFDVAPGELVCVVGESGSGKTVTGQAILGLAAESGLGVTGSVRFADQELIGTSTRAVRALRGRDLALVPQEPASALDPYFPVGAQMAEAVRRRDGRRTDTPERVLELLRAARVPEPARRVHQYPHELSGGQCQRVLIAMALAGRPRLIIADEPTSALDATVQLHLLELLDTVRRESGTSILLVTHDMGVAARADRVVVMYAGTVVEQGPAAAVLAAPRHPYTAGLLASTPSIAVDELRGAATRLPTMPGSVPAPGLRPPGCAFRERCPLATERCAKRPELSAGQHGVACHHSDLVAGTTLWTRSEEVA